MIATGQGLTGNNMFVYCGNNPVMRKDTDGQGWLSAIIAVVVVVVVVVVVAKVAVDSAIDSMEELNDAEKELAKSDYIAAYQVNEARKITAEYIDDVYGAQNDRDNTQVNAYRHAMWNAIMTDKMGAEKAKKFADAHEQFPDNPYASKQMDLHNNALGRKIAQDYAGQGYDVFSIEIQNAIQNGEAVVIEWDPNV